jgi:flagellar motor switch protein FliM
MTDRLMGGSGQAAAATRELSEIEVALLDQVVQFIAEGWCGQWSRWQSLKPTLLGHESDPRYLQTSPPDATLLVATMNARLGESTGQLQLAFPFATLEPLLQKLRTELNTPSEPVSAAPTPSQTHWNAVFDEVKIPVAAELPGPQLPARSIPKLKVGDVLNLPADSAKRVQLCLGGLARFTGLLGTRDDNWAVELTAVLKT